jgi:hypothetical protein
VAEFSLYQGILGVTLKDRYIFLLCKMALLTNQGTISFTVFLLVPNLFSSFHNFLKKVDENYFLSSLYLISNCIPNLYSAHYLSQHKPIIPKELILRLHTDYWRRLGKKQIGLVYKL